MTALRVAGTAALLLSALLGSVPANAQAYVPGITCPSGQAMTGYTPQTGIACGVPVMRSYLAGLVLSNDATSPNTVLDIAAGQAADSTDAVMVAIGAFTKSTAGAWASGSGSNGMGNGLTIANSTWYHVCLANNSGAPDLWFDTSVSCANKPSGITDPKYRRIGSFLTNSSAHIVAFKQNGDEFLWAAPPQDLAGIAAPTSATLKTFTVPTGLEVWALLDLSAGGAAATLNMYSPDGGQPGTAQFQVQAGTFFSFGPFSMRTNASAQLYLIASSASATVYASTYGWVDRRGRDN